MWQLSIVSPLILASFCLGACELKDRPNNDDRLKTVLAESGDVVSPQDRECIPYYRCSKDGTFTESGEGRLDVRIAIGKSGQLRKFCTEAGYCVDRGYTCCRYASVSNVAHDISPSPPVARKVCGPINGTDIHTRITGDSNELSKFPWMVLISLELKDKDPKGDVGGYNRRCMGSLIGQNAVLTAAHCIDGFETSKLRVRAGNWVSQAVIKVDTPHDRLVEKVLIHPQYNKTRGINNFAILILDTPVDQTKNVDVVCLARFNQSLTFSQCFISGYGEKPQGNNVPKQPILRRALVRFVPRKDCEQTIRNVTADNKFVLDSSRMCTDRHDSQNSCQGNGGAPLVCAVKNDPYRYVQVGIATSDFGCGYERHVDTYASVPSGRTWIDDTVAANDLDTSVYRYSP